MKSAVSSGNRYKLGNIEHYQLHITRKVGISAYEAGILERQLLHARRQVRRPQWLRALNQKGNDWDIAVERRFYLQAYIVIGVVEPSLSGSIGN
jgi:hypothetical protein